MNILITGGLGYVGGRLTQALARDLTNRIIVTTRRNPSDLSTQLPGNVKCVATDSFANLNFIGEPIEAIIHLASLNEIDSLKNPVEAVEVNTTETVKLLSQAEIRGIKKIIYFSTAHVYRSPLTGHITETDAPRPLHPYAITHKAAEDFVLAKKNQSAMDAVVIRLSNSFGAPAFHPVNRWTLLVNELCKQAVVEKALILKSSGQQKRDFICLYDVCEAVKHLLKRKKEELLDGVFNLGGNNAMKILDMAKLVQSRYEFMFGEKIGLSFQSPLTDNISEEYLHYDISKLLSTGFTLKSPIHEEIDNTLLFCRNHFAS